MKNSINILLDRYQPKSSSDCIRALREIMQEIALVGLWRAKFFEHAAFYGGTALRILYGLDRFSEDLDFSLLKKSTQFSLEPYFQAIQDELAAFGFSVTIEGKKKNIESPIESAFIKANTILQLIQIGFKHFTLSGISKEAKINIKIEIDADPPPGFQTEVKVLKEPLPISINTYCAPDLFAGKMHATLCRLWQERVKGRDWYDFVWFVRKGIPLHLDHLETRMKQSGCLPENQKLTQSLFFALLEKKIDGLNWEAAKRDIRPFISDAALLENWTKEYFREFANQIVIL